MDVMTQPQTYRLLFGLNTDARIHPLAEYIRDQVVIGPEDKQRITDANIRALDLVITQEIAGELVPSTLTFLNNGDQLGYEVFDTSPDVDSGPFQLLAFETRIFGSLSGELRNPTNLPNPFISKEFTSADVEPFKKVFPEAQARWLVDDPQTGEMAWATLHAQVPPGQPRARFLLTAWLRVQTIRGEFLFFFDPEMFIGEGNEPSISLG